MAKPMFSLGELLVLLDVEGVSLTAPFPTVEELAAIPHPLPFRAGLNHMYRAPNAYLSWSPIAVELTLAQFADSDIYKNMHDYVQGYLEETLTKAPKAAAPSGFRAFKGHGVMVHWGYDPPRGDLSAYDAGMWLRLLRDEPPLATVHRLFGVDPDALKEAVDANPRAVPSRHDMRVEVARIDEWARLACSAPSSAAPSPAALCLQWTSSWLYLLASKGTSLKKLPARAIADGEHATSFDIGAHGTVLYAQHKTTRRDAGELYVPWSWIA